MLTRNRVRAFFFLNTSLHEYTTRFPWLAGFHTENTTFHLFNTSLYSGPRVYSIVEVKGR